MRSFLIRGVESFGNPNNSSWRTMISGEMFSHILGDLVYGNTGKRKVVDS